MVVLDQMLIFTEIVYAMIFLGETERIYVREEDINR